MDKEIRWKQRYSNFEKAYHQLEKSIRISNPSETERAGLIQFFEITFELAWKTLKDYLESEGYQVKSPRETIKQAYQIEIIDKGKDWLQALEDRNLVTHVCDEKEADKVEKLIKEKYYPLLNQMFADFRQKVPS